MKAFVQEEKDLEAFDAASRNSMEKTLSAVKLWAVAGPFLDTVTGVSILLTLVFGGRMVLNGQISIGQFVAFNSYIGMLVWPMIACGDSINIFTQAAAAFKRISMIFREEPDITDHFTAGQDSEQGTDLHIRGEIDLRDLSFTYPDGELPVLSHVNLHIAQGEMLGILARTGSGKSTLADLLLRV